MNRAEQAERNVMSMYHSPSALLSFFQLEMMLAGSVLHHGLMEEVAPLGFILSLRQSENAASHLLNV